MYERIHYKKKKKWAKDLLKFTACEMIAQGQGKKSSYCTTFHIQKMLNHEYTLFNQKKKENTGVGGPDFTQVTRFNEGYLCLCKNWDGHLMRRVNSLEKTLMLGGIGGRRRRGRQRMRWLDGITGLAC